VDGWSGVDPSAVAAFYQGKGYKVREGVRLPGLSGNEHKVPLLAEGPLGSLAVFFGDFGGVDGPEMGGARKVARDLGATPVLAADSFSNDDRQVAARLGVVLLDSDAIAADDEPPSPAAAWPGLQARAAVDEPEPHPWPASGRVGGRDGPATRAIDVDDLLAAPRRAPIEPESEPEPAADEAAAPERSDGGGLWTRPRTPQAAPKTTRGESGRRFGWLGVDVPPAAEGPMAVEYDDVVPARAGTMPMREPGPAACASSCSGCSWAPSCSSSFGSGGTTRASRSHRRRARGFVRSAASASPFRRPCP
jgi:hypothetical protein